MRYGALLVALVSAAALGGCSEGVLDPKGPIAAAEREILFNSLAIMLAIVVPTIVATLVFAWWYRAGNTRARYLPNFQYSGQLELLVWSVPALVVLFLGGIAWISSHEVDPAEPLTCASPANKSAKPVEVEVVSLDWKWLFIYPDQGIATVNEVAAPLDTPINFRITATSFMNSFFVPAVAGQIYAMPGMVNAHCHSPANLVRGRMPSKPLEIWRAYYRA